MRKSKLVSYTNRFQQKYQALKYRWMSISAASNFCAMVNVCEECLIKRIIITDSWAAAATTTRVIEMMAASTDSERAAT